MFDIDEKMAADPAKDDMLILVDGLDREIGQTSKIDAHIGAGHLHRAFSVVLYRNGDDGIEILLAKRSLKKYHSGGFWANSCCSHPRAGEHVVEAAYRRVSEELGVKALGLSEIDSFVYHAAFANGITEHEYDHVLIGTCGGEFDLDPAEVSDVRWLGVEELSEELMNHPDNFAVWAPIVLSMAMRELL